jgi:hypothetical protein
MTHSTSGSICSAFTSSVLRLFIGMFVLLTFSSNQHVVLGDVVKGVGGEGSNRKEAA